MTPSTLVVAAVVLFAIGLTLGELAGRLGERRYPSRAGGRLKAVADAETVQLNESGRAFRVLERRMGASGPVVLLTDGRHQYRLAAGNGRLVLERVGSRYPDSVPVTRIRTE